MKDEKAEFSARLRAALRDARIDASASVLEKRFNSRYSGTPVTAQAISGWLNGKAIPRQDKLRVLAALVGLDPHVLQYGGGRTRINETKGAWEGLNAAERAMVDAYIALAPSQRKLVRELVAALAEKGARNS
ncbi:MAG TPA: transcriptional regulator [Gammaproteobacteria bacterium]|nr:transcriptional regulator [Gammaproteobacteria bacterium]